MTTTLRLSSLALRNLGTRKSRTFLTIAGVVLGVAVILATTIANRSTIQAFGDMIDSITGKADFWINGASSAGFSENKLSLVSRIDGVEQANPGISRGSTLRNGRHRETVQVAGIDPRVDRKLRQFKLATGRFIKKDEFAALVPIGLAKKSKIKVGDRVTLVGSESPRSFIVSGLLKEEGAGRFGSGKAVFIPLSAAQRIFGMEGKLNYIDAKAEPGRSAKRVGERISKRLGSSFVVERPENRVDAISQMLRGLTVGLSFFGTIALFVGAFLVYNTFAMVVVEQTQELGMLRSLGGSRGQVARLILTQAGIIAVFGSILGVGAGIALAKLLLRYMARTVQMPIETLSIPYGGLIWAVVIGIIVTLAAALQPALLAGRISPLAAIRVRARQSSKKGTLIRLIASFLAIAFAVAVSFLPDAEGFGRYASLAVPLHEAGDFMFLLGAALIIPSLVGPLGYLFSLPMKVLFGDTGKIAAANLRKNPGRTAATVSAVMITLAMLISVGGMVGSFRVSVDRWVDKSLGADVFVSSQTLSSSFNKKFVNKLKRVRGVADLTMIKVFPVRLDHERVMFRAIEPKSVRRFAKFQFTSGGKNKAWRELGRPRRIFISNVLSHKRQLKVGDKVELTTVKGRKVFHVAAVVVDFGGDMGDLMIGTRRDMKTYFDLDDANALRIKVDQGVAPRVVAKRINKKFKDRNLDVEDIQVFKDRVTRQVNDSFAVFNVLILLAAIVAVISVFNTLTMSILERRREIGVLRALGATRGQIALMTLIEAFITGAIGVLVGLVVGAYISRDIVNGMNLLTGYDIDFTFPINTAVWAAVLGLAVAMVAAVYPARRAATYKIAEAIQHE